MHILRLELRIHDTYCTHDEIPQFKDPALAARLRENAVTMTKMGELRAQMRNLSMAKRDKGGKATAAGGGNGNKQVSGEKGNIFQSLCLGNLLMTR